MKCHYTELKTNLAIIPGRLTCKLQALDIGDNHVFKIHVRIEWERWMQEGIHTYTQSGKMRKAKFAEVWSWVLTAWGKVPTETIVNIHKKTLFAPESDEEVENSNDGSGDDEEEVGETRLPNAMLHLFHSDSETS